MSKHTQGPWYYDGGRYVRIADTDGTICEVCDDDGHVDPVHAEILPQVANARLIAAAPDMLEALQALFRECAMIHRYGGDICNQKAADAAIDAGRAAIEKATRSL